MKTLYFFNSSDRKIRDIIRSEGLYVGVTYRGRNTTKDDKVIFFFFFFYIFYLTTMLIILDKRYDPIST